MVVRNDLDRYHLVMEVIDRTPSLRVRDDTPEITEWTWPVQTSDSAGA